MTDLGHRDTGPTPGQVLGPAAAAVALLLVLAFVVQPAAFEVTVGPTPPPAVAAPEVQPSGRTTGAQAAPPREDPRPAGSATGGAGGTGGTRDAGDAGDAGATGGTEELASAALGELLRQRDAAVASRDAAAWTAVSADPTDATAPDGSFTVLTTLPLTRFESSVTPDSLRRADDTVAGGDWQAQVDTLYALAGATPVLRSDTVVLDAPSDGSGWRVVSWAAHPALGEVGTSAPWDLGEVRSVTGDRGVVLAWSDPATPQDGSVPSQRLQEAQAWGGRVSTWVDRGAVVVDSYLGTGWPRTTLVLAPATTEQYDALVPGPVPGRPDVFAAVTTDVRTAEGGGDLVVLNPAARGELVDQTWQVTVTHELVHVASGARYGDGQEIWLAEGLADLVGWSTVVPAAAGREEVAGRLLERVASGAAEVEELPQVDDFSAPDADVVGDAYEGAWLAVLLLQDELGTDALLELYEDASEGPGSARQRTDGALREATGEGREAFRARWAAYLTSLPDR